MSRQTHLQSAARHILLDNVEAGGHALRGLGLHAPHPLELHYMPASKCTSYLLGHTNVLLADNPVLEGCEAIGTQWMPDLVLVMFTTKCLLNITATCPVHGALDVSEHNVGRHSWIDM